MTTYQVSSNIESRSKRIASTVTQTDSEAKRRKIMNIRDEDAGEPDDSGEYKPIDSKPTTLQDVTTRPVARPRLKTKQVLTQEAVQARKDKKEAELKTIDIEKEMAHWKRKYQEEQLRSRELEADKLKASQQARGRLLDDTEVRADLARLFQMSYQWAMGWARKDLMGTYGPRHQVPEIIQASYGGQNSNQGFLSDNACQILPFIRNGGRLLVEGILNHIIVDEIFRHPLDNISARLLNYTGVACETAIENVVSIINKQSPNEARLLHAHCVRATNIFVDHVPEDADILRENSDGQVHYEEIAKRWLSKLFCQLLKIEPHVRDNKTCQARRELTEICVTAGKLSRRLWTQNVHITVWGCRKQHLRHLFRLDDTLLEPHRCMKITTDAGSFDGKSFDMLVRPAIHVLPIDDPHAEQKVWLKAVGVIFSEHICEEAFALSQLKPFKELSDYPLLGRALPSEIETETVQSMNRRSVSRQNDEASGIWFQQGGPSVPSYRTESLAIPGLGACGSLPTNPIQTMILYECEKPNTDMESSRHQEQVSLSEIVDLTGEDKSSVIKAEPKIRYFDEGIDQEVKDTIICEPSNQHGADPNMDFVRTPAQLRITGIPREVSLTLEHKKAVNLALSATLNNSVLFPDKGKTQEKAPVKEATTSHPRQERKRTNSNTAAPCPQGIFSALVNELDAKEKTWKLQRLGTK